MIALLLAGTLAAMAQPVITLGLTLDLPKSAVAQGDNDRTMVWHDDGSDVTWSVERRGDGSGNALPITLGQAARMVPDAMGARWTDAPAPTRIDGAEAATLRFGTGDKEARTWTFLAGGYLYAVTVIGAPGAIEAQAAHLAATLRAPHTNVPARAPLDLAQLGLALPGAADLGVATIAGAVPAVAMLDAKARAGLILARLPAASSAFAKKDPAGVAKVLEGEGCRGVVATSATFGGLPATQASCTRGDGKGGENIERVVVVQRGASVWVLRAVTDTERAASLDAWADARFAGARLR